MDLDVEIAKCDKKLDLARLNLGKILKVEGQGDYKETVPETVRLANEDKVREGTMFMFSSTFLTSWTAQNTGGRDLDARVIKGHVFAVEIKSTYQDEYTMDKLQFFGIFILVKA